MKPTRTRGLRSYRGPIRNEGERAEADGFVELSGTAPLEIGFVVGERDHPGIFKEFLEKICWERKEGDFLAATGTSASLPCFLFERHFNPNAPCAELVAKLLDTFQLRGPLGQKEHIAIPIFPGLSF